MMNGQTRAAPNYSGKIDYSQLNLIKKVIIIKNYRGYSKIYYIKPFGNTHFAYLDGGFMGFTVPEKALKGDDLLKTWFMEPKEAIDYYLDRFNVIFRNSELEYVQFVGKEEYKPFITALKYKMDMDNHGSKDKTKV